MHILGETICQVTRTCPQELETVLIRPDGRLQQQHPQDHQQEQEVCHSPGSGLDHKARGKYL